MSIRQIAAATGLSASRVHQVLQADEAREIPTWLSHLRAPERVAASPSGTARPSAPPAIEARLTDELEVVRWCLDWLERLERGDEVVVHVCPATEEEPECVPCDRPRVLRVLPRRAADLDELTRRPMATAAATTEGQADPRAQHRRQLAEPEPTPRRLRMQEERAALRQALRFPPSTRR